MKVSVVIPMYNESGIIKSTALSLNDYMAAHFEDYEILFSNDGSLDDSARIVRELNLERVFVTGYEKNRGKGCAVRTAILQSKGDIVIFTDADLAYGLDVIGQCAVLMQENPDADMMIGSRNLTSDGYAGYTLLRRVMSKAYIRVLCLMGGFRLSDSQCGFKAFRAKAAKEIFSRCEVDGFAFDFEVILWAMKLGYTIREMPIRIINHRESKIRVLRDTLRMLRDMRRIKKKIKKANI